MAPRYMVLTASPQSVLCCQPHLALERFPHQAFQSSDDSASHPITFQQIPFLTKIARDTFCCQQSLALTDDPVFHIFENSYYELSWYFLSLLTSSNSFSDVTISCPLNTIFGHLLTCSVVSAHPNATGLEGLYSFQIQIGSSVNINATQDLQPCHTVDLY